MKKKKTKGYFKKNNTNKPLCGLCFELIIYINTQKKIDHVINVNTTIFDASSI